MSRWSDEFHKHPIHQLLIQAVEHLEVDVAATNAAFEDERRRLKNVIGNLRAVVAELDPEFYPQQWLDQIYQHFNAKVLNQLQAYSTQKDIGPLRAANDAATHYTPHIFHLAAMSRPQEVQQTIDNAQTAFTSFTASIESNAKEIKERLSSLDTQLSEVNEKAANLEQKLTDLDTSLSEKLTEWQQDFTENQTTRAEEYSETHIKREEEFSKHIAEQREKFDRHRTTIVAEQQQLFDTELDAFKLVAKTANEDMREKQETIRNLHNLVTDETVTGGYHRSAQHEASAANFWRFGSIGCLIATAIWLGIKTKTGFPPLEDGGLNWPDMITASSLTAIFLYTAGYMSRQSKMHRQNATLLRSYALETQALDPFISSLEPKEQQTIKAELVRRMFGQQNVNGSTEPTHLDDGTVKTLVDKVSDNVVDVVRKLMDKS